MLVILVIIKVSRPKTENIDKGNGEVTIADYAYAEAKVLILIDGLSDKLHSDPTQSQKDRLLRAKTQM